MIFSGHFITLAFVVCIFSRWQNTVYLSGFIGGPHMCSFHSILINLKTLVYKAELSSSDLVNHQRPRLNCTQISLGATKFNKPFFFLFQKEPFHILNFLLNAATVNSKDDPEVDSFSLSLIFLLSITIYPSRYRGILRKYTVWWYF